MERKFKYTSVMAIFMTCAFVSCSSDDEPVNNDPDNDVPKVSEFQATAENKIWTPSAQEETVWVTTDGQTLTAEDLEPVSGSGYQNSYHFTGGEASRFQFQVFGPGEQRACRYDYSYEYDEETGAITFAPKGNGAAAFTLTVESLSADRMVIRDTDLRESAKGEIAYRRVTLVPVDKAEEQQWWDTYVKI